MNASATVARPNRYTVGQWAALTKAIVVAVPAMTDTQVCVPGRAADVRRRVPRINPVAAIATLAAFPGAVIAQLFNARFNAVINHVFGRFHENLEPAQSPKAARAA